MPSKVGNLPRNGNTFGVTILRRNGSLELLERAGLFQLLHQTFDRFLAPFALDGIVGRGLLPAQQTFHDRRTKLQHFLRQIKRTFPSALGSRPAGFETESLALASGRSGKTGPIMLALCEVPIFSFSSGRETTHSVSHNTLYSRRSTDGRRKSITPLLCGSSSSQQRNFFFGRNRSTHTRSKEQHAQENNNDFQSPKFTAISRRSR